MKDNWYVVCGDDDCVGQGRAFELTKEKAAQHYRVYHPLLGEAAKCILCQPSMPLSTANLEKHLRSYHMATLGGIDSATAATPQIDIVSSYKRHLINCNINVEHFDLRKEVPNELLQLIDAQSTLLAGIKPMNLAPTSNVMPALTFLEMFEGHRWYVLFAVGVVFFSLLSVSFFFANSRFLNKKKLQYDR